MTHPHSEPADKLPVLTEVVEEVVEEALSDDLPMLTEVVEPPPSVPPLPALLSEADIEKLQRRIEAHLEAVFTQKLAALQRQATEQTLAHIKASLPGLIRETLNTGADKG